MSDIAGGPEETIRYGTRKPNGDITWYGDASWLSDPTTRKIEADRYNQSLRDMGITPTADNALRFVKQTVTTTYGDVEELVDPPTPIEAAVAALTTPEEESS